MSTVVRRMADRNAGFHVIAHERAQVADRMTKRFMGLNLLTCGRECPRDIAQCEAPPEGMSLVSKEAVVLRGDRRPGPIELSPDDVHAVALMLPATCLDTARACRICPMGKSSDCSGTSAVKVILFR